MAKYYLKYEAHQTSDAHRGGAGTLASPFLVADGSDGTSDLDAILAGTYSGSTAAVSGDEYIFTDESHDWGALTINNNGTDGVTFTSATVLGNTITTSASTPIGPGSGTPTFTVKNFKLTFTGTSRTHYGTCYLDGCEVINDFGSTYMQATSNQGTFYVRRCLFLIRTTYTQYIRGTFYFDNSTVISCRDYSAGSPQWVSSGGFAQFVNCILVQYGATAADGKHGSASFGSSSNNLVHNFATNRPSNFSTANPSFRSGRTISTEAAVTDNFRLRQDSPALNQATQVV